MRPRNHLIVFARAPRLGRVKSRLAADIGAVAAWVFYRRTLDGLLRRLNGHGRWRTLIAVTPDGACNGPAFWPPGWRPIKQGNGGLGQRMERAMKAMPAGPVVIVGADVPDIGPAHIAGAFRALGDHDAVFGPATDGGYWLVGLRRRPVMPEIFNGVRWSTEHALADTLANLPPGAARLQTLDDVDDGAGLERWRKNAGLGAKG